MSTATADPAIERLHSAAQAAETVRQNTPLDPTWELTHQTRDANAVDRIRQAGRRDRESAAMPAPARAGIWPEAPLLERVAALESDNHILNCQISSLMTRIAKLESK